MVSFCVFFFVWFFPNTFANNIIVWLYEMNFNSQPFNYNNIIEWREVNTKRQNEQTPIQNDKTNTEKNPV